MFLSTQEPDVDLLAKLSAKAMSVCDLATVREVINVIIAKNTAGDLSEELLLPALHFLTEHGDAGWVFNAWYRPEASSLMASLNATARRALLNNLLVLPKIDYHAEEILALIATKWPSEVVDLMIERLNHEIKVKVDKNEYEAVPFEFYKLNEPLSVIAGAAVRKVRAQFDSDRDLFEYRGGRLLRNIFPQSTAAFESALLELIRSGQETDLEFVLGVMKNYHGEAFVRRLCKEVVRGVDADNPLLSSVAIALLTTGVVSGEFGLAEAYIRKKDELVDWLGDPDEKVRLFAKRYTADLEKMIEGERQRAQEELALRKHRYGEG